MQKINNAQLAKLHVVLGKLNIAHLKGDIIYAFTKGRTKSSKALTRSEGTELIKTLADKLPDERIKSAIWIVAYKAGLIYGEGAVDNQINRAKLDSFLKEQGTVKKALKEMNLDELKKTHRQIEGMLQNNKKAADNKHAKQATHQLLKELNITVK